ncbi:MAG: putative signal-transduction protein with domain [Rariglobus sp.]|jgi:CBS domain-containing protein|nr:putative signal-transduction protein with domain [Rariglobus sp.]
MNTPLSHILSRKDTAVITVTPSTTVHEAVCIMNQFHIGSVLVTSDDKLVGIFTERDVLSRIVGPGADAKRTSVQAVMTTNLITATPSTTVEEAMTLFMERRIRHLPILNDGAFDGIISIGDINRHMLEENLQEARQLRHYIHGEVPCAV